MHICLTKAATYYPSLNITCVNYIRHTYATLSCLISLVRIAMDRDSIQNWINRIEPSPKPSPKPLPEPSPEPSPEPESLPEIVPHLADPRKRKSNFTSPPPSHTEVDDNMTSTPQKRRRFGIQGDLLDPDSTPRQSSASISNSQVSSGQLSIKSQLDSLEVDGMVKCISLSLKTVPLAAMPFFETMEQIEGGTACFISDDKPDNLPGRIPPPSELEYIRDRTDECNDGHEESTWNTLVHIPLLRLIFENDLRKRCDDFTAANL